MDVILLPMHARWFQRQPTPYHPGLPIGMHMATITQCLYRARTAERIARQHLTPVRVAVRDAVRDYDRLVATDQMVDASDAWACAAAWLLSLLLSEHPWRNSAP